ncbi:serine hydrolase domain-containing protein [Microbulbifer sp. ARAS458-1]|uniref:serine hydrolase domain-containing protein n=1 Tax=Microbulbifer sp. ARAS458-1 TaxID=3140242 RepID=UPI003877A4EA
MSFRIKVYLVTLIASTLLALSWVHQPLMWKKIPYRLQAFSVSLSGVWCEDSTFPDLVDLLRDHLLPNFALEGQVIYLNREGEVARCSVSKGGRTGGVYRLASMTKAITAHAALVLSESGDLKLNAHLLSYFPEVDLLTVRDPFLKEVMVYQLINHSSGFGGPFGSDDMVKKGVKPWCPYDFKRLESVRLAGVPGSNYVYSNVAYCLLGEVISRVTGLSYRQYVQDQYLEGTDIEFADGPYFPEEPNYDFSNDFRFTSAYVDWLDFWALSSSAGLVGRPEEFARLVWDKLHRDAGKLLSGSLVASCGEGVVAKCYSWNFELEFNERGGVIAGVQQGYMPGVSSLLAITPSGQVIVWVAAGAPIENHHKVELQKAVVEFLESRESAV